MGLWCKRDGCVQVLKDCRCPAGERRRWQAVVWIDVPGVDKMQRKQMTSAEPMTKKEALTWYGALKADANQPAEQRRLIPAPAAVAPVVHTFKQAADQLLKALGTEVKQGVLRPTTLDNHSGHINKWLLPEFGARPIAKVDVAAVEDFTSKLRESGKLKSRTIRCVLDTLGMILGAAMRRGWTEANPIYKMREAGRQRGGVPVKSDARKSMALTVDEMLLLEAAARGNAAHVRLPVMLMAFAGMRRGEALGLQRRDFDGKAATLSIERIVTHGDVTTPKASSARVLPVPDWLAEELRAHLRAAKKVALDGSDWLFTVPKGARKGEPIYNNVERTWARVRKALIARIEAPGRKAELAGLRLHDLRHSFATALAEARVEPTARQHLLGHASLKMTSHYTHPSALAKKAAAAALPSPNSCVTAAAE